MAPKTLTTLRNGLTKAHCCEFASVIVLLIADVYIRLALLKHYLH